MRPGLAVQPYISIIDIIFFYRYGFRNPYYNRTFGVHRPIFHNWTYIRTDQREFRQIYQRQVMKIE